MSWRVGTKIPLNVYDGDRAVCQCHNEEDARKIVGAMNGSDTQRMDFLERGHDVQDDGCGTHRWFVKYKRPLHEIPRRSTCREAIDDAMAET